MMATHRAYMLEFGITFTAAADQQCALMTTLLYLQLYRARGSIFGYRFRVGLPQKKGFHDKPPSEFGLRVWFYTCHRRQQACQ